MSDPRDHDQPESEDEEDFNPAPADLSDDDNDDSGRAEQRKQKPADSSPSRNGGGNDEDEEDEDAEGDVADGNDDEDEDEEEEEEDDAIQVSHSYIYLHHYDYLVPNRIRAQRATATVANAVATDETRSSISKPKLTMKMKAKMMRRPPRRMKVSLRTKSPVISASRVVWMMIVDIESSTDNAMRSHRKTWSAPPKATCANTETVEPQKAWDLLPSFPRDFSYLVSRIQASGLCDAEKAKRPRSFRPSRREYSNACQRIAHLLSRPSLNEVALTLS